MKHVRTLLAAVLLALTLTGETPGQTAVPPENIRFQWIDEIEEGVFREFPGVLSRPSSSSPQHELPDNVPPIFLAYPTSSEVLAFLDDLESAHPDLAERFLAGISWQGAFIAGIRLGNEQQGDPETRPALYLDGQHHAREAIASQAVLYAVWWLLDRYGEDPLATYLLDTRTIYAIPMVNPDGNDIWLTDDFTQRRNANPTCCDDDGDGLVDEDPANGMGFGTYQVYRYTFYESWVIEHPDNPFAPGWESHLLSTIPLGVWDGQDNPVPQVDDDHDDSRYGPNEDPIGGVDLNRNYDAHWELGEQRVNQDTYRGPTVWSELESRAVRDWVLSHPNILAAASLHSGADVILHPWAWSQNEPLSDGQVFERLARKGSQLTECCGFLGAGHTWTGRGLYIASGSTMDWLYAQGIYAVSPEIYAAGSIGKVQRDPDPGYPDSFLVYTSVGLAFNPEPVYITTACERWRPFLLYLAAAVPSVSFTDVQAKEGTLVVRVANDGGIPVAVTAQVTAEDGQTFAVDIAGLRGREFAWRLPLDSAVVSTVTLTATAQTLIATNARAFSTQSLQVRVEADSVDILEGEVRPFVALRGFFGEGGWDADPRRWEAGYHWGPPVGYSLFFPAVVQ